MAGDSYPIEMVNGVPVVAAPAEIDVTNADWLRAVLLEAAACGHGTFVVDMTGTQYCASAGIGVLVRAHNWAVAEGGELRLVIPASCMVLRIFALTGIDQVIPNFADLDEALAPPPAAAPPATAEAAAPHAGDAHQPGLTVTTSGARLMSRGLREPAATARLGTTRWRRAPSTVHLASAPPAKPAEPFRCPARAAAGTIPTGIQAPRCRTPPCARPRRPLMPPAPPGSRTAPRTR
jgi:anti-sigma B factor antagonist